MKNKNTKKIKKKIGLIIIIIGAIITIYPVIANILVSYTQTTVISTYNDMIKEMEDAQIELEIEKAREYNERLNLESEITVKKEGEEEEEKVSYLNVLNIGKIMGYLDIPKINAYLPIYHGTNDSVLQSGVGHLENSSFPIGEKNTHSVLAGHSGLARIKVFDDIDKLQKGDLFFVNVFGESLAYEVDQIKIVLPEETKYIQIEPDKEYVTLITCTPYAINSHRLLVRGERVKEDTEIDERFDEEIDEEIVQTLQNKKIENFERLEKKIQKARSDIKILIIVFCIVLILGMIVLIKSKNNVK